MSEHKPDTPVVDEEGPVTRPFDQGFNYISRRRRKAGRAWINENPNASTGKKFKVGDNKETRTLISFANVIVPGIPEVPSPSETKTKTKTKTKPKFIALPSAEMLGFKDFLQKSLDETDAEFGYFAREVPFSNRIRRLENARHRLIKIAQKLNKLALREYGKELSKVFDEPDGGELKARNIVAAYANIQPKHFEWLRLLVLEACFSDEKYGGNKGGAAWKAMDFDPTFVS